jgi:hypothetical protein
MSPFKGECPMVDQDANQYLDGYVSIRLPLEGLAAHKLNICSNHVSAKTSCSTRPS